MLGLAGGAYFWVGASPEPVEGTASLVVGRKVIDLGTVAFETPVRAVFNLKNTGDGVLRLAGAPLVRVLAGC